MKQKSLGQIAFEAYYFYRKWEHCDEQERVWFENVGKAVAREVRRRDKAKGRKK